MTTLLASLQRWQTDGFNQALKHELEHLAAGALPLERGTSRGGFVDDSDISVSVTSTTDDEHSIQAEVGVFFTEIITGCSCGDDPMRENAYCEIQVSIDKSTGEAEFSIIQD